MTRKRDTFGVGVYEPTKEVNVGTLSRSAYVMGADFFFTIGARVSTRSHADTTRSERHLPFLAFNDFEEARRILWQYEFVAVEQGGESLATFKHPKRAVYLLGSESRGLPEELLAATDTYVEIETLRPISLNVAQTGGIVMYDRIAKRTRAA